MKIDRKPRKLIELLSGPSLRCRTGILLVERRHVGQERDIAAKLGMDSGDYQQLLLKSLPEGSTFVDISVDSEIARLDELMCSRSGTPSVLVYSLDLALTKLDSADREKFWDSVFNRLPNRRRSLIITMPESAEVILPRLEQWEQDERIAKYTGNEH